ncbi:MAG: dinitrogenase iron-molybdenum cofactor biosynthesis protein [bacterium]|nr:dinitrogenase iron-molybdenum cofactor biosynthesis protein [bacterium]
MRIAITATGASLEAQVDPRFGRCPFFLIVDPETMAFDAVENGNAALGGGAGIQSAQLVAERGVQFVLTGNCGPNAHQALSAAGVQIVVGCSGPVRETLRQFQAGTLSATDAPNVVSHFGMPGESDASPEAPASSQPASLGNTGPGMGRGMGMGRGGGRGMGRGMGMGVASGFPAPSASAPVQSPQATLSKEDEVTLLKEQAEAMAAQMTQLQERIRQLEEEGR